MKATLLLGIVLMIGIAQALVIEEGVTINTNNLTWNFSNDITLDNLTIGNKSLVFENDNLTINPNSTGTTISVYEWENYYTNQFRLRSNNKNITYNINVNGEQGTLYYNNTWLYGEQSFIGLNTNLILLYGLTRNITITARNLDTNQLLENVTVRLTGVGGLYNSTFNETTTINNIIAGEYNLIASKPGYGNAELTTNLILEDQSLTVYLSEAPTNVEFTVKDSTSGLEIEGANILIYRDYDGELISDLTTDYTGTASADLSTSTSYTLISSKSGYTTRTLSFNPSGTTTSFTIYLERTSESNETIVTDKTIITINDYWVYNNNVSWVLISIYNGFDTINSYSIGLSANNNNSFYDGTDNAIINATIDISNAEFGDYLRLQINYSTVNGYFTTTRLFPIIIGENVTNGGFEAFKFENTGLSYQVAVIIATIIILLFAGVGAIAGSLIGASGMSSALMGVLASGIFSYLGWIPSYAFYIVAFVGAMYIISRFASGGGS